MPNNDQWSPLPRAEVVNAVERRCPSRIPLIQAKWWGEGLVDHYGPALRQFDRYPEDATFLWINSIDFSRMGLSWEFDTSGAHDARSVVNDWSRLDEFIERLPNPEQDTQIDRLAALAEQARREDRYTIFAFWHFFFERPWQIRGMQNLLMDYKLYPEQVHRMHDALCDLYCGYLRRAIRDLRPDGFWTSDDLGHQTSLFMRPSIFREFIQPYYARIGQTLHSSPTPGAKVHWWLHSCGNNTPILGDLVEAGVDVFHPVQKYTMDEVSVAREYGGRITFLAGIDVQHTLQEKDPDGVRAEVRFLIDTFDRPEGGLCLAAGNGIVPGTPLENIDAFLDEALRYGLSHRQSYAGTRAG
jgi:uroporphyrinogen decarboxylase